MWAGLGAITSEAASAPPDAVDSPTILVVGHGGGFMAVLPELCPGLDRSSLPRDNHNSAISELLLGRSADGRLAGRLVRYGDYSHLHGEAARVVSGLPDKDTFRN